MLIAYYRFNNNLNDEMKKYHLTHVANSGAIVPSSGILGSGYQRPAVNNGIDRFSTVQQVYLHGSHSYSCWAFVTGLDTSTANGLVTNHDHNANTGSGITVRYVSATDFRISCNTGNGTSRTFHTYYGTTNIKDKWCHLAFTYDGPKQELKLWVNGNLELTQPYAMKTKPDPIEIFNWSVTNGGSNNYRPACILDEVRIYNHCLSIKEIKELSMLKSLHLSADSGLTVDKEGKYQIVPSNVSTANSVKNSLSFQFNGNGSLAVNSAEAVLRNMTVEFWIYPENIAAGTRQTIFNKGYGSEGAINITDARRIQFFTGNGNGNTPTYSSLQSIYQLPLSQWTHVVVVRDVDNSELRLYINGILDSSVANTYIPLESTIPLTIGSGYTESFIGRISNLVVYGTAADLTTSAYLYRNRGNLDNYGNLVVDTIDANLGFTEHWDSTNSYSSTRTTIQSFPNSSYIRATSVTSNDPWIDMPGLGNFDPQVFKFIQIRYRVISGSPTRTEIYFYNSLYTSANSQQVVTGNLNTDGNWHILTIDMTANVNWLNSPVTGWRFDWCNLINVTMDIDFIRLAKTNKPYSIEKTGKLITNDISELGIVHGRSLLLYIPFTGTAKDYSTNRYETVTSSLEFSTIGIDENGSAVFNGSSFIEITETVTIPSITISTWVYYTGTSLTSTILSKGNTSYELFINTANKVVFGTSSSTSITSAFTIPINTWTHIGATFSVDTAEIYINGILDTLGSCTFSATSLVYAIGKRSGGTNFYQGNLADFRIYSSKLSQSDIEQIYSKGKGENKLQSSVLQITPSGKISEIIV